MVSGSRVASVAGTEGRVGAEARRFNAPRSARVEANASGFPVEVNHQAVAFLREEWRVVDRWWTEDPVQRRYFDVVLEGGERTVVYRDQEAGGWFSQRGV